MPKNYESKAGTLYSIVMIIIIAVVVLYLLCDFEVLPPDYCAVIEGFSSKLTDKVNNILGI